MENLCVPIFGQKNILRQQHAFFIGEAALAAGATAASVVGAGGTIANPAANGASVKRCAAPETVGRCSLAGAAAPQWRT